MARRRWSDRALVTGVIAAGVLLLGACQLIVGLEAPSEGPYEAPGSIPRTIVQPPFYDRCNHALPLPPADAAPPGDQLNLFFAARHLYILSLVDGGTVLPNFSSTSPNKYPGIGFDVDDTCTCFAGPTAHNAAPSCRAPGPAGPLLPYEADGGVAEGGASDGPTDAGSNDGAATNSAVDAGAGACDVQGNGIDNNLAIVYLPYQGSVADPDALQDRNASQGKATVLIFVGDYNGLPDDDFVTVAIGGTYGTCYDSKAFGCPLQPNWDGGDTWFTYVGSGGAFVPSPETDGGVAALNPITTAYVRDGVLYFPIDKVPFYYGTLTGGYGAFRISKAANGVWQLTDGVVGGRIDTLELMNALLSTLAPDDAGCPLATTVAGEIRTVLCPARDVMLQKVDDFTKQTCNGISFGASIVATQAKVLAGPASPPAPFRCDFNPSCD